MYIYGLVLLEIEEVTHKVLDYSVVSDGPIIHIRMLTTNKQHFLTFIPEIMLLHFLISKVSLILTTMSL